MMGAQVFLTKPRRTEIVDASDLGRYSRLEHGTPDPAWIAPAGEDGHRRALERWLRGDDGALDEWLGGPTPRRPQGVRTTA